MGYRGGPDRWNGSSLECSNASGASPMQSLFENAIQSIQIGIEDYQHNDPKRALSAVPRRRRRGFV
jgi:hypothetical protein